MVSSWIPAYPLFQQEQCTLNQALIQDRRNPGLSLLAASQTKDKEALTQEGVTRVIRELQKSFDYVVCDSPAGIESGESKGVPRMRSGVLACLKSRYWYGHLFHIGVPSMRSHSVCFSEAALLLWPFISPRGCMRSEVFAYRKSHWCENMLHIGAACVRKCLPI